MLYQVCVYVFYVVLYVLYALYVLCMLYVSYVLTGCHVLVQGNTFSAMGSHQARGRVH